MHWHLSLTLFCCQISRPKLQSTGKLQHGFQFSKELHLPRLQTWHQTFRNVIAQLLRQVERREFLTFSPWFIGYHANRIEIDPTIPRNRFRAEYLLSKALGHRLERISDQVRFSPFLAQGYVEKRKRLRSLIEQLGFKPHDSSNENQKPNDFYRAAHIRSGAAIGPFDPIPLTDGDWSNVLTTILMDRFGHHHTMAEWDELCKAALTAYSPGGLILVALFIPPRGSWLDPPHRLSEVPNIVTQRLQQNLYRIVGRLCVLVVILKLSADAISPSLMTWLDNSHL